MHQRPVELERDPVDGIPEVNLLTEPDGLGPFDRGRLHLGQELLDRIDSVDVLCRSAQGCVHGVPADDRAEVLLERRRLVEHVESDHPSTGQADDATWCAWGVT